MSYTYHEGMLWRRLDAMECFMCAMRDNFPRLCEDCSYVASWPGDVVFTWEEQEI